MRHTRVHAAHSEKIKKKKREKREERQKKRKEEKVESFLDCDPWGKSKYFCVLHSTRVFRYIRILGRDGSPHKYTSVLTDDSGRGVAALRPVAQRTLCTNFINLRSGPGWIRTRIYRYTVLDYMDTTRTR